MSGVGDGVIKPCVIYMNYSLQSIYYWSRNKEKAYIFFLRMLNNGAYHMESCRKVGPRYKAVSTDA
jgi:hypothetical protein